MPNVVRLGDLCSGHSCYPSRQNLSASADVFVEDLPVHREGDLWDFHRCGDSPPHDGITVQGSPTVFVNDKPVARIGDLVDCDSTCMTGAATVSADDSGASAYVGPITAGHKSVEIVAPVQYVPVIVPSAFINGSFELPVIAPSVSQVWPSDDSNGWTASNPSVVILHYNGAISGFEAFDGVQYVHARVSQYLEQQLALLPGTYRVTMKLSQHPISLDVMGVVITLDGVEIGNYSVTTGAWVEFTTTDFVITEATTLPFRITVATGVAFSTVLIDDARLVLTS